MDRQQAPCPQAPAGPRRCQCLAGPIRPRNNPSARAFLGLPSPNSVTLVDHWHPTSIGNPGLDSPDQPVWRIIHRHLSLACGAASVSVSRPRSHLSLLLPIPRLTSHQPIQPKPNATQAVCSLFTDYLSDPIQVSSPSPYPKYTLSSPPALALVISPVLARSLDSR